MNWQKAVLAAAVVLPLLVILGLGFKHDPHAVPSMLEGKPAPDFSLRAFEGPTLELAALKGKPVVLNFWATWCYPCQAEHALLQEAAAHYGSRVQFIGVIYQDSEPEVRKYLRNRESHYPQVFDPQSRTAIDFGVAGVPESFIIDAAGMIVHKEAGVLNAALLRKTLDALVEGKS